MSAHEIDFEPYRPAHRARCLEVFEANCPEYFAPNERGAYAAFLDAVPAGYEVCVVDAVVVGAFGLVDEGAGSPGERAPAEGAGPPPGGAGLRLNWILIDPALQGRGVGSAMMKRVVEAAAARLGPAGSGTVDIAASHRSAPFFARFGAEEVERTKDGWGPGMHRVDMRLPV